MPLSHPSVLAAFVPQQMEVEGWLPFMYLDRLGLVTTGLGNLLDLSQIQPQNPDPGAPARSLPWVKPDGTRATPAEITDEWRRVKARTDLISPVGGRAFANVARLRLPKEAISALVRTRFLANEELLAKRYPFYPELPAPAQSGLHAIAWGTGPSYHAPALDHALSASPPDFHTAAEEGQFRTFPPARRELVKALFLEAADVQERGGDYSLLTSPSSNIGTESPSPMAFFGADNPSADVPAAVAHVTETPAPGTPAVAPGTPAVAIVAVAPASVTSAAHAGMFGTFLHPTPLTRKAVLASAVLLSLGAAYAGYKTYKKSHRGARRR